MATIKARLDKATRNWAALRETVDSRNVAILHRAGLTADMPIAEYPADVLDYLAMSGWTAARAHDLLRQWRNALDDNTVVVLNWGETYEWDGQGKAPGLVISADLWGKLQLDAPGDAPGEEELPPAAEPAAPPAQQPDAPPEPPPAQQPPAAPKVSWEARKAAFQRETRGPARRRPGWTTR